MQKLLITLCLILAPALAYAEMTIITGDDDNYNIQIMTSDDDGVHWKTLNRTGDNSYMEYDWDTGEMRTVFDFRNRPQDNRGQPGYRTNDLR